MPEFVQFGEMSPLLILGIILVAGMTGGALAQRLKLPGVTGNLLAGVIVGPAVLNLFSGTDMAAALLPLSTFAMALITVVVGSQLSYRRIHNALRRIISITFFEVLGALTLVTLAIGFISGDWYMAFILGCVSTATAPATTVALVRETRAKGSYVKTLLSVVALDNMACILLFAFSSALVADFYGSGGQSIGITLALSHTFYQFFGSLLLGILLGAISQRLVDRFHLHDFSAVFVVILLSVGLSQYFNLNTLMTSLFLGVFLGNSSEEVMRQTRALEPIEMLLFACFFTVAGASMHLDTMLNAGLLCGAYLIARFIGKFLGACIGGIASISSRRIWFNAGFGLVPQAGVAIGLVVLLSGDPRFPQEFRQVIETVVLGAVVVNEITGPFFTRLGLRRANETDKDRRRLIEFLHEEFIAVNIDAKDKWDALYKITDFYCKTHHTPTSERDDLYATIESREKEQSTGIGLGAAIPHGRIERGTGIRGVLAIMRDDIDFEAIDGQPVRLVMLVVTPKGYENEHLEVMASLARMISDDAIRTRLLAAVNANDAWEVIESEETPTYNYFLESDTEEGQTTG